MVRAKLICNSVESYPTVGDKTEEKVSFSAVCSGNPEDNSFAKATPFAYFTMQIQNPEVFGKFQAGNAYYADLTPATT